MKQDQFKILKSKSEAELQKELQDMRDKIWQLRLDLVRGKVKNVQEIRLLKKTTAVIATLIKERKIFNQ